VAGDELQAGLSSVGADHLVAAGVLQDLAYQGQIGRVVLDVDDSAAVRHAWTIAGPRRAARVRSRRACASAVAGHVPRRSWGLGPRSGSLEAFPEAAPAVLRRQRSRDP